MPNMLNKSDINTLREMYESASGEEWSSVYYLAKEKRYDFNYHYYANDVAVILCLFEGVPFGQTGIMFMEDLANPVHHAIDRLKSYAIKGEALLAKAERTLLVQVLKAPLDEVLNYLGHVSYDPSEFRSVGDIYDPIFRDGRLSHIALISAWRAKIGK